MITNSALKIVEDFLKDNDWGMFRHETERSVLLTRFAGDHGDWNCCALVREAEQQFMFYSLCPVKVPAQHRSAMAEFITRANYDLTLGNFEMDFEDGETRLKTYISFAGSQLDQALVQQVIYPNVLAMNAYLPGMIQVAYGQAAPEQAIEAIEAIENPVAVA